MQRRDFLYASAPFLAWPAVGALAQPRAWPERPITMVYPYAAGGAATLFGIALAERLQQELGQPVVAESRSGAGGAIGCAAVARAKPDGYTILLGATGATLITPYSTRNPGFDPVRDFESVALLTRQPMTFIVSRNFPARTLKEAVDLIKANPGTYSYASAGTGALAHLGMEYLMQQAGGLKMTHVPYKGGAPAMSDVIGGHVPMLLENLSVVAEQHRMQRVRVLAVLAGERSPLLPQVPTAIEQGFPNLEVETSYLLMAPKGTPAAVLDHLDRASRNVLGSVQFQQFGHAHGIEINTRSTPALATAFVRSESAKWSRVVRAIGFQA